MTEHRIISHTELRDEMMAVARGEKPAPAHAGTHTFESVEALTSAADTGKPGTAGDHP